MYPAIPCQEGGVDYKKKQGQLTQHPRAEDAEQLDPRVPEFRATLAGVRRARRRRVLALLTATVGVRQPREMATRLKIAGLTMEYFQPTRSVSKRQQ